MANLDSTLKSRDITLLTKVLLVKAMFFPVALCGCESWTVKKAEHRSTAAFSVNGILRQEHAAGAAGGGSPRPPPGDHPHPELALACFMSPALAGGFFTTSTTWEAQKPSC